MQTSIANKYRDMHFYRDAEEILRRCVHCGFCNATCPTFQLLGDELDGPRGRIYLVKQVLEGAQPTVSSRRHLDRCLTCLSCETTCPSGVEYGRLLEIGRELHNDTLTRPWNEKLARVLLRKVLLNPRLYRSLLSTGHLFSRLLPASLRGKLPPLARTLEEENSNGFTGDDKQNQDRKTLILLRGCVQRESAPQINQSMKILLTKLGYRAIESTFDSCCGALSHHNDATEEARQLARHNIEAWWPYIEKGIEAIMVTASGCAVMVKDYGHLLHDDKEYAEKAKTIASLVADPAEIIEKHAERIQRKADMPTSIAYHAPCTQQHGLGIKGHVEKILVSAGFELTPQAIPHLCCGSAGSYSLLQPEISSRLLENKLADLISDNPALIATGNIGCLLHLQSGTEKPVIHWCQAIEIAPQKI